MRRRSGRWTGVAPALAAVAIAAAGGGCSARGAAHAEGTGELAVTVLDTLRTPGGYAVGKPVWISVDRGGRAVVADQSDKSLKLFDPRGRALSTVGRPGSGPGEFTALLGGGLLGDSLYAYDFNQTRFTVFSPQGRYARSVLLGSVGEPMPAAARVVDDTLVLVVGFAVGAHTRDLLRLMRPDGTQRASFFNLSRYFSPENPDLIQASSVYADGAGGTVFAGVMGLDSLYAFDYAGRKVGAGAVRVGSAPLPSFKALIAGNRGRRLRPDRTLVYDGVPALVAVVAVDATHAVLQVMKLDYRAGGRLDRTDGGSYLLATLDPAAGTITTGPARELEGGLSGRDAHGAIVARYVGPDFDQIELMRLERSPAPEVRR